MFAEYFDHWDKYTSMTSKSMNVHAGFIYSAIAAKFSSGYTSSKSHMYSTLSQSKSTRVQIRHKLYTVKIQPGAPLHPIFKSRVLDIAANIQKNNTEYARYLAELIVRDYGTHYVSSMDAGAIISKVDFIRSSQSDEMSSYSSVITASASASFFGLLSVGTNFQHISSHADTKGFANNLTYSEIITAGGPPFSLNMTLAEWESGIPNALVAIDRSGNPLHFVINPTTLPTLPERMVRSVSEYIHEAIDTYYKVNIRPGCTDPSAKNFNFHANLNDDSCSLQKTNFSFGGIYQVCDVVLDRTRNLCEVTGALDHAPPTNPNPLTGDKTCPDKYTPVLLQTITLKADSQTMTGDFWSIAKYKSYWCAAIPGEQIPQADTYLFGGLYTSKTPNPATGAKSCPQFFFQLSMGRDINICVSNDYEQGKAYAVDFAGFYSCSVGNPMAARGSNWPPACPSGYAPNIAAIDKECKIEYCLGYGKIYGSKSSDQIRLPPFHIPNNSMSDTLVVSGVRGKVWVKEDDGKWTLNIKKDKAPSSGTVAAISIVGTIILGVMVIIVIFTSRYAVKYFKRQKKNSGGYMSINDSSNDQGLNPANDPPSDAPTSAESV